MLNQLTIIAIAAAIALADAPAFAFDIPDHGSKNFSPGGDTPSYFTNESVPVSTRTADTTDHDWSAVEEVSPEGSVADAAPRTNIGRHGKQHAVGRSSDRGHSTRFAKTSTGRAAQASGVSGASIAKTASAKSTAKSAAQNGKATAAGTHTAKHGKGGARHARAAITEPAAGAKTNLSKEA